MSEIRVKIKNETPFSGNNILIYHMVTEVRSPLHTTTSKVTFFLEAPF